MNEPSTDSLARFANGPTIVDRWTAAKELMAARQLVSVVDTDGFNIGFQAAAMR
jgi:hypothetical protein